MCGVTLLLDWVLLKFLTAMAVKAKRSVSDPARFFFFLILPEAIRFAPRSLYKSPLEPGYPSLYASFTAFKLGCKKNINQA